MSNLFIRHFVRVLENNLKISLSSTNSKQLKGTLSTFRANYDLRDYTILHRFPRKDLKTLISLPCPIKQAKAEGKDAENEEKIEENEKNEKNEKNEEKIEKNAEIGLVPRNQTISSMKNLRFAMDVREYRACNKCPLKETCLFKDQVPEGHKANLTDLIIALIGFAEKDPKAWKSLVESSEKLKKTEEKQPKAETEEKEAKTEETEKAEKTEESEKTEKIEKNAKNAKNEKNAKTEKTEKTEETAEEEMKFKYWNSGLKVTDSLSVILQDLYESNGLESRRFINGFLEELSKSKRAQKTHEAPAKHAKNPKKAAAKEEDESSSSDEKEEESEENSEDSEEKPKKTLPKKQPYGEKWQKPEEFEGNSSERRPERPRNYGGKPAYGDRDRNYSEKPRYGGDRDRKPSYGGDRDRRSSYGGDRDRKPSYGGDRDRNYSKPSYGGDRDRNYSKPSYGGDRDRNYSKPSYGGDRDRNYSKPNYGGDRDRNYSKPSYGGDRGYGGKPSYGGDRYGGNNAKFEKNDDKFEKNDKFEKTEKFEKFDKFDKFEKYEKLAGKPKPKYERYEVNEEEKSLPKGGYKKEAGEGFIAEEGQVKTEKFMRDSNKEFKKYNRTDENMRFKKRPQREDFPVVEKDDMLVRRKTEKGKDNNENFSFSETENKKN